MAFLPGQSGNPSGRPKGQADALKKACDAAAKEDGAGKGVSVLQHLVNRAYKNDTVLIAVAKKLLPDLKHVDVDAEVRVGESMTDAQLDAAIARLLKGEGIEIDDRGKPVIPKRKKIVCRRQAKTSTASGRAGKKKKTK